MFVEWSRRVGSIAVGCFIEGVQCELAGMAHEVIEASGAGVQLNLTTDGIAQQLRLLLRICLCVQ